jgi:hypothetical protein
VTLIRLKKQVSRGSSSDSAPYTPSAAILGVALGATAGGDAVAPQPNAANSVALLPLPPPPHRCRYAREEDQDANGFLPIYHKLEFLKFDGSNDPLG